MKIPRFDARRNKPWMIRHQFLARIFLFTMLPLSPFIFAIAILWEHRDEFEEIGMIIKAIFLPWKISK